jgi:tetratricopeptide (TPR) repeat protein
MLMKQYDVAITLLNGIMHDESKSDFEKAQACYLVGRCQELKGDFDKALESYEAVPTTFGTPAAKGAETEENPAKFLAENELRKFFCFFRTGRLTQAAAALSRLTETGALIDGASVWHFRDALQRCLVTPRLDEALAILRNARFASLDSAPGPEEKGLTLFLISQATSKSLYNDFLEKAVRLAARFGQGTHTSFTQIAEVYKAFPDPAMSPAIRQGLRQATRMGKLDEALTLLKFARESLPKTEDLDAEAEDIGKRFCELQQFQRVQDVYTSHPSAKLLVCFQRAVDGLLKQGERDAAKTLYSKATDIAKKQEVMSETAYESLDKMAANLMDAYTRTGSYPQLIEILSAPGRSSLTLVAPVEAALARTIENGEFDQAIEILRVFRQRSLPPTETLLRQIQRLADTLAEKQMVQAFKSAYNAYPVEKLADSLVRLMTSCHDKEGYASCVELLKFAKDKLDAGHFKEAGPKFEEFLVRFAAVANSRRKFQEIIAAHRAFPSDKLLPQFVQAIDLSLRPAETGAEATPPPDYPFLVNLFPYARQSWPFPQATELHQRLLKFARGLLAVAHGATPQPETPKKPDDAPRPAEEKALAPKVLETLLKSFRDAIEDSKEKGKAYYGLSVDYADLLLVANRFQEAGKHLDELAPNLPRQHDLRDDVLLRLAAIVSDSGERTTAIALWKILSEENGPEGPYARLFEFMTGEPKESAFQGWKDPALQAFLTAQRAQLQGGDRAVLRTAIEQVVQLCKDQPTWYLAIAESRLRKLEKAEPAPKPAEETRKEGKEGAKEGKAPDSPGAP